MNRDLNEILDSCKEKDLRAQELYEKAVILEATDSLAALKVYLQACELNCHESSEEKFDHMLLLVNPEISDEPLDLSGSLEDMFYRGYQEGKRALLSEDKRSSPKSYVYPNVPRNVRYYYHIAKQEAVGEQRKWVAVACYILSHWVEIYLECPEQEKEEVCYNYSVKAAQLGFLPAQYWAARNSRSSLERARWIIIGARGGCRKSRMELAQCYMKGRGVEVNENLAFQWYSSAWHYFQSLTHLEQDDKSEIADVAKGLATCYAFGKGVEKNGKRALEILRERDWHSAQQLFAEIYEKNLVPINCSVEEYFLDATFRCVPYRLRHTNYVSSAVVMYMTRLHYYRFNLDKNHTIIKLIDIRFHRFQAYVSCHQNPDLFFELLIDPNNRSFFGNELLYRLYDKYFSKLTVEHQIELIYTLYTLGTLIHATKQDMINRLEEIDLEILTKNEKSIEVLAMLSRELYGPDSEKAKKYVIIYDSFLPRLSPAQIVGQIGIMGSGAREAEESESKRPKVEQLSGMRL